jgi:hypothetical protein
MLLSFESIRDSLKRNRCVLGQSLLSDGECVFSKKHAPSLYSGRLVSADKSKIRDFVQVLVRKFELTRVLIEEDIDVSLQLRKFFGICVSLSDSSDESFLHSYIYLFWTIIRSEANLGRKLHELPKWGSREFGLLGCDCAEGDERSLADKLFKSGVEVDIFSLDSRHETICLIEIKRAEADDRAIGQILRYYQIAWELLSQKEFRRMNINYIWPILIVNRIKAEHLQALPLHFRGLLDILTFSTHSSGILEFSSHRRGAFSSGLM